jgi:hypothetical protein
MVLFTISRRDGFFPSSQQTNIGNHQHNIIKHIVSKSARHYHTIIQPPFHDRTLQAVKMNQSTCSAASLEFVPRCLVMRTVLANRPTFYDAYNEASFTARRYFYRNLLALVVLSIIAILNFSRRRRPRGLLRVFGTITRWYVGYFAIEFFGGYYENGCITQHEIFRNYDLSPESRLMIFNAGLLAVASSLVVGADLLIIWFHMGVRDRNLARKWQISIIGSLAAGLVGLWVWIHLWSDVTDGWCEAWESVISDNVLIVKGSEGKQVTRANDLPPGAVQAAIAAGQIAVYYLPAEVWQAKEILASEMKRRMEGLQTIYIHYWAPHF